MPGGIHDPKRRLVGRRFLGSAVAQEVLPAGRQTTEKNRPGDIASAGDGGGAAQDEGQNGLGAGIPERFVGAGQMTAGDMAGFVRDHPDQLVRRVGRDQQAGVNEDFLSAGDERVQRRRLHDQDFYGVRVDARGLEQWRAVDADGSFDFRIPDHREAARLRGGGEQRQHQDGRQ